jgi:hypothetical protein
LLLRLSLVLALLPATALAQRDTTREALARLDETMVHRLEDGVAVKDLLPAIVVSVAPAFEESKAWYPTAALASLVRVFGSSGLRACEACLAPRLYVEEGKIEQSTGALSAAEITRLDEASRGKGAPARTAIWLDETAEGVSLRIIDLANSRIVLAENFDPALITQTRTIKNFSLSRELDRRAKGESLAHTFIDVAVFPGQHVSFDWTEQWGDTNANLSGVSLSAFDPVLGIGAVYFRVIPQAWNLMVGAKVLMSVPTAAVNAVGQSGSVIDPLLTGVLLVRLPIFSTNYAVILSASTNGKFGIGISFLNFSLLPFLP